MANYITSEESARRWYAEQQKLIDEAPVSTDVRKMLSQIGKAFAAAPPTVHPIMDLDERRNSG